MTTSASLIGARLRRIDAPSPDLWAITLAAPEIRGTLLVSLQPGATGVGWAEKRPHGLPATSFVQKLRKELEGGRLVALEEVGSRLELSIARSEQARRLAFDFATQNVLLFTDAVLVASAHKPREREVASGVPRASAAHASESLADEATWLESAVPAGGSEHSDERTLPRQTDMTGESARAGAARVSTKRARIDVEQAKDVTRAEDSRTAIDSEQTSEGSRADKPARADELARADEPAREGASPSDASARGSDQVGAPTLLSTSDVDTVGQTPRSDQTEAPTRVQTSESARTEGAAPAQTTRARTLPLAANAARAERAERRVPFDVPLSELEERARSLLADRGEALLALRKTALVRGLRASRKKLARKLAAISGDAARAEDAPALRQRAQLLLANLHAIARGATTARLLDYTLDPPAYLDITLDPAQSPRELAEAWFKRARRFERGAAVAAQRSAASAAEVAALDALEKEIEASAGTDALDALAVRAERLGVKSELPDQVAAPKSKAREPARHVPYRTLIGSGERKVLVGKGASDNDVLTRDHARPHDLWMHARDVAGAHVVVPLTKGEVCPPELLVDAAHLAAHFSDARGETTVDVSYTPRRYVRKPKGAADGLVVLEREKVLRLQLEAARLAKLLQNERQ